MAPFGPPWKNSASDSPARPPAALLGGSWHLSGSPRTCGPCPRTGCSGLSFLTEALREQREAQAAVSQSVRRDGPPDCPPHAFTSTPSRPPAPGPCPHQGVSRGGLREAAYSHVLISRGNPNYSSFCLHLSVFSPPVVTSQGLWLVGSSSPAALGAAGLVQMAWGSSGSSRWPVPVPQVVNPRLLSVGLGIWVMC